MVCGMPPNRRVFVFLFTESLWRTISNVTGIESERDEQVSLNTGRMNIKWKKTTPLSKRCFLKEGWEGEGRDGIKVYVIPQTLICRSECCDPKRWEKYYNCTSLWFPRTNEEEEDSFTKNACLVFTLGLTFSYVHT